jgi:hypothetical protein
LKKANDYIKRIKDNNKRLRTQLQDAQEYPFAIIEHRLQSYARKHNLTINIASRRDVVEIPDQLLERWDESNNLREHIKSLEFDVQNTAFKVEKAERDRAITQNHASVLEEQVHTLQRQILASVDKNCAVSDDKLMKDFRCLVASIKALSRSIIITKDTNILEVLGRGCLLIGVDAMHWNTRARKKAMTEAWIWSVLMDRIFASPFALSEDHGGTMTDLWYRLFGADHDHSWPVPSMACEQRRYKTMDHHVNAFGLNDFKDNGEGSGSAMHDNDFDSLYHEDRACFPVRNKAISIISSRLATVSAKGNFAQIPGIIDRAMTLTLEMSLQRCRLQVTYPAVNANFVESQMSAVADADGEDMQDGVVAFVVHPGLTKWGDANGKDLDQRYDIAPSLVQLQPLKSCAPE